MGDRDACAETCVCCGEARNFIICQTCCFDCGHDLRPGDVFLAFGIDDPDGSVGEQIFAEELRCGFDAEEDEAGLLCGACL